MKKNTPPATQSDFSLFNEPVDHAALDQIKRDTGEPVPLTHSTTLETADGYPPFFDRPPLSRPDPLATALARAINGWPVFPLWSIRDGRCACGQDCGKNAGKHPIPHLAPHGFKNATTDTDRVREWWTREPDANIGIPTGAASGIVVIDFDDLAEHPQTIPSFADRCGGYLPISPLVRTGNGAQLYCAHDPGRSVRSGTEVLDHLEIPGVDVKGEGGYVVAPGSVHRNGKIYHWLIPPWRAAVAAEEAGGRWVCPVPEWFLDALEAPRAAGSKGTPITDQFARLLEGVPEGCRHDAVVKLAGRLIAKGLREPEVLALLRMWNPRNVDSTGRPSPLPDEELVAAVRHAVESDRRNHPERWAQVTAVLGGSVHPDLIRLADVAPESVSWLWPGRIAKGKLHVIAGDPGLGKSCITLDIAARVSTGAPWPNGGEAPGSGDVIVLSAEDGGADTIRPRVDAMKGDANRVHLLRPESRLSLENDTAKLREMIAATRAVLLIVDPLNAYLGRSDSYKDAEVRRVLTPLAKLAEETGVAIIALMHLTKDDERKALYRPGGSIGFVAAARVAFVVAKDLADTTDTRRFLSPLKVNLAKKPPTLAYRLVGRGVGGIETVAVEWEKEPATGVDADTLLAAPAAPPKRTKVDEAVDFLRYLLAEGPMTAKEAEGKCKRAGYHGSTLDRARMAAGVAARRLDGVAGEGVWVWELPSKGTKKAV